jgi:hypothetical protein
MHPKDRLMKEEKSGVIYKIDCNGCSCNYVGETSKKLKSRLHEHELCVKRKDQLSLIAQHSNENDHTFNFTDAKILGRENNKAARLFKESWYSDKDSINRHVYIHPAYLSLRHKLTEQNKTSIYNSRCWIFIYRCFKLTEQNKTSINKYPAPGIIFNNIAVPQNSEAPMDSNIDSTTVDMTAHPAPVPTKPGQRSNVVSSIGENPDRINTRRRGAINPVTTVMRSEDNNTCKSNNFAAQTKNTRSTNNVSDNNEKLLGLDDINVDKLIVPVEIIMHTENTNTCKISESDSQIHGAGCSYSDSDGNNKKLSLDSVISKRKIFAPVSTGILEEDKI